MFQKSPFSDTDYIGARFHRSFKNGRCSAGEIFLRIRDFFITLIVHV